MTHDEIRERACKALADEAERLQTQLNEFIGRATMARVDLPAALYDADAELLLLPARLREAVVHRRWEARSGGRRGSAQRCLIAQCDNTSEQFGAVDHRRRRSVKQAGYTSPADRALALLVRAARGATRSTAR